jgi:hypothetical protein
LRVVLRFGRRYTLLRQFHYNDFTLNKEDKVMGSFNQVPKSFVEARLSIDAALKEQCDFDSKLILIENIIKLLQKPTGQTFQNITKYINTIRSTSIYREGKAKDKFNDDVNNSLKELSPLVMACGANELQNKYGPLSNK